MFEQSIEIILIEDNPYDTELTLRAFKKSGADHGRVAFGQSFDAVEHPGIISVSDQNGLSVGRVVGHIVGQFKRCGGPAA